MKVSFNVIKHCFEDKKDWYHYWITKFVSYYNPGGRCSLKELSLLLFEHSDKKYYKGNINRLKTRLLRNTNLYDFSEYNGIWYLRPKSDKRILSVKFNNFERDYLIINKFCLINETEFKAELSREFLKIYLFWSLKRLSKILYITERTMQTYTQLMKKQKVYKTEHSGLSIIEAKYIVNQQSDDKYYCIRPDKKGKYSVIRLIGVHVKREKDYKYYPGNGFPNDEYERKIAPIDDSKKIFTNRKSKNEIIEADKILKSFVKGE